MENHSENIKKKIFEHIDEYYNLVFKNQKKEHVPVSGKKFDSSELKSAVSAILDGWWTDGNYCLQFESLLSSFVGVKHATFVNSGSSANLLALTSLTSKKIPNHLEKGQEVITLACSFPTTVNPIIQNNLIPVFCDIDLETLSIDINQLKKAVSEKTKAIFIAHTLGNPFNLNKVKEICERNNLFLIEDCCDALGSEYDNKKVGTFGDLATCSFYPAHHITTIEGGVVFTNNALLHKIVRSFRDWGRDCWCPTGKDNTCGKRFNWKLGDLPEGYDHKYIYSEIGYNLKSTDINAAIGIEQFKKLNEFTKFRQENFDKLSKGLKKYEDYLILPKPTPNSKPSWFGFLITIKDNAKFTRKEIIEYLNSKKIHTRLLFAGNITKQPYFKDNKIEYRCAGSLENTDKIMNNSFWVGISQISEKTDADKIVQAISEFIENGRK